MEGSIIIAITSAIVFLICTLFCLWANLPRLMRYRQFFLAPIALVYGIIIMFFSERTYTAASMLAQEAINRLPILSGINAMCLGVGIVNCLVLLAFVVLKLCYGGLVSALGKVYDDRLDGVFGIIYSYDRDFHHWYVRSRYVGMRRLARNLFISLVIVCTALVVVLSVHSGGREFVPLFYPALAVIVAQELFYFLDGLTREEYESNLEVEDDRASQVFQYAKAQKALMHFFSDRLLIKTSLGKRHHPHSSARDFCESLIRSDDPDARLCGTYFLAILDKGMIGEGSPGGFGAFNHDHARSTIRLIKGLSVLYASPFYRDFLPYVFFPMNESLLRGGKALIIYGDGAQQYSVSEGSDRDIARFIEDGLAYVAGVRGMWNIGDLDSSKEETPDVALMPFSMLSDAAFLHDCRFYFEDVSFVMIIEPSAMLAPYQLGLSTLAQSLSSGHQPTYCMFDRNSDGLLDALSHALRVNIAEVSATEQSEGDVVRMLWDADGGFLQHRLFPGISHFLGTGTEIGLVALKSQISKIAWASTHTIPLVDQRWVLGQYYGELFDFAELPQEQGQIDERFQFYSMWEMPKERRCFVVAEDEIANLFETCRQFSTRGSDQAFVNIVASSYLLRDYMVSNSDMFEKDPKAIPSLAPDFSKGRRNVVFAILMLMLSGERRVTEKEVKSRLRYAGIECRGAVQETLEVLIAEQFEIDPSEDVLVVYEEAAYDPALDEIITKRSFGLSQSDFYIKEFRPLKNVPLVTEAPDGMRQLLGSRLFDQVGQIFLPGQTTVISGKNYEVQGIDALNGVVLKRAADLFSGRRYYRQLRRYHIYDWHVSNHAGGTRMIRALRVEMGTAHVFVKTIGYLDMSSFEDIAHARRVVLENIEPREYSKRSVLKIHLEDANVRITSTIAVLISELLRTLYPQDWSYLAVLAPCASGLLPEGVLYECEITASGADESCDSVGDIYIVEDSLIDIGLLSSLSRNLIRILEMCLEYLDWLIQGERGNRLSDREWEIGQFPGIPSPYEPQRTLLKRLLHAIAVRLKKAFTDQPLDGTPSKKASTPTGEGSNE